MESKKEKYTRTRANLTVLGEALRDSTGRGRSLPLPEGKET